MSVPTIPMPHFGSPPVIETLLGVQFSPLAGFSMAHFGLYWSRVRSKYPDQEIKPPLVPVLEEEQRPVGGPALGLQLVSEPEARCWLIDASATQLVQIQRDRFIRNWRRVRADDRYPRYETLKPLFSEDWGQFVDFLGQEGLGVPEINQCEVTYINHIEVGAGWETFGQVDKVVSLVTTGSQRFLPEPEMLTLEARYPMPEGGRLRVMMQPAIRRQDAKEVLQLTLTARGRPRRPELGASLEWFDLGHEWIVRGFTDLTTAAMHTIWRRTP